MISHFSWKPLFPKEKLPGWKISFYYKGTHYEGIRFYWHRKVP